jgi:hypothetical protein
MRNLFETQLTIAEQLTSNSEKFNYLSAVLRSLFQAAAVTALEIIRELTPDALENAALSAFAKRFKQPTDGLPVEILDIATPVIRSYVSRTYHTGWFERDQLCGNRYSEKTTMNYWNFYMATHGYASTSSREMYSWS